MISLAGLHPGLRPYAERALAVARYYGIPVEVTSVKRSWAEQVQLRERYLHCLALYGRTGLDLEEACHYPANEPGDSAHQAWRTKDGKTGALAFDSYVPEIYDVDWAYIRRAIGFRVPANDKVHAELPNWRAHVVGILR